jgi:hypothetical protein
MATLEQQRTQVPAVRPPRPVRLGPRDVKVEQRPDGTFYLESPHALASYPAKLTERSNIGPPRRRSVLFWRSAELVAIGSG